MKRSNKSRKIKFNCKVNNCNKVDIQLIENDVVINEINSFWIGGLFNESHLSGYWRRNKQRYEGEGLTDYRPYRLSERILGESLFRPFLVLLVPFTAAVDTLLLPVGVVGYLEGTERANTKEEYPTLDCRMNTFIAGALKRQDRPLCWFFN